VKLAPLLGERQYACLQKRKLEFMDFLLSKHLVIRSKTDPKQYRQNLSSPRCKTLIKHYIILSTLGYNRMYDAIETTLRYRREDICCLPPCERRWKECCTCSKRRPSW